MTNSARAAYELLPVSEGAVHGSLYVFNYTTTYAMHYEYDAAFGKPAESLSQPHIEFTALNAILHAPAFHKLHDEAAFKSLVEKYRLRDCQRAINPD